jgi:hypothetical protein
MHCHHLDDVAHQLSSPSMVVARPAVPASVKKRKGRGTDVAYLVVDPRLYPLLLVVVVCQLFIDISPVFCMKKGMGEGSHSRGLM